MKKFTFILGTILVSTFVNAQIVLEHTFEGRVNPLMYSMSDFTSNYFIKQNSSSGSITIYNNDFSLYKTISINLPSNYSFDAIQVSLYNIFSANKLGFVISATNSEKKDYTRTWLGIFDEDGVLLKDLGYSYASSCSMCKINNQYYLLVWTMSYNTVTYTLNYDNTYVYSLPCDGSAQSMSSPSISQKAGRKNIRNGQVYIETETNIYSLMGSQVK